MMPCSKKIFAAEPNITKQRLKHRDEEPEGDKEGNKKAE